MPRNPAALMFSWLNSRREANDTAAEPHVPGYVAARLDPDVLGQVARASFMDAEELLVLDLEDEDLVVVRFYGGTPGRLAWEGELIVDREKARWLARELLLWADQGLAQLGGHHGR